MRGNLDRKNGDSMGRKRKLDISLPNLENCSTTKEKNIAFLDVSNEKQLKEIYTWVEFIFFHC